MAILRKSIILQFNNGSYKAPAIAMVTSYYSCYIKLKLCVVMHAGALC